MNDIEIREAFASLSSRISALESSIMTINPTLASLVTLNRLSSVAWPDTLPVGGENIPPTQQSATISVSGLTEGGAQIPLSPLTIECTTVDAPSPEASAEPQTESPAS